MLVKNKHSELYDLPIIYGDGEVGRFDWFHAAPVGGIVTFRGRKTFGLGNLPEEARFTFSVPVNAHVDYERRGDDHWRFSVNGVVIGHAVAEHDSGAWSIYFLPVTPDYEDVAHLVSEARFYQGQKDYANVTTKELEQRMISKAQNALVNMRLAQQRKPDPALAIAISIGEQALAAYFEKEK